MLLVFLLTSFVPLYLMDSLRFYPNHRAFCRCLRSRAMHKSLFSTPSISSYTISPTLRRCGPRSATQPLRASFSPRRRPAGASYGISIRWLRMRSPLFGGEGLLTGRGTASALALHSGGDGPAPSPIRRPMTRPPTPPLGTKKKASPGGGKKCIGPSPRPSRAAFFEAKKACPSQGSGKPLDCGSWAEEFFFCPQAVRPVCVAGLLHA